MPQPSDEQRLIEKLEKIETLFARAACAGERTAAGNARERILRRLAEFEQQERAIEHRFTLADAWSKSLLLALLRRYDIRPYRYRGQRRTTVMARVTPTFVAEVLGPEFQQLDETLHAHLDAVTKRVIAQAIHRDVADAEERAVRA